MKGEVVIQLYRGDCLEEMKKIESGSVDMVLADPPYGTTQNKWDSIIPLDKMWEELKRVLLLETLWAIKFTKKACSC